MDMQATRRHLCAIGGLGLAVAATTGLAAPAPISPPRAAPNATEQANITLVREFIMAFLDPSADFAAVLDRYLTPNASMRWSDAQPAVYGPKAALVQLMASYPKNAKFTVDLREVFAHGPLVSTYRIDTVSIPGRPDVTAGFAGVCVVKGGKIVEYCDYYAA